jgi:hypothetical protein
MMSDAYTPLIRTPFSSSYVTKYESPAMSSLIEKLFISGAMPPMPPASMSTRSAAGPVSMISGSSAPGTIFAAFSRTREIALAFHSVAYQSSPCARQLSHASSCQRFLWMIVPRSARISVAAATSPLWSPRFSRRVGAPMPLRTVARLAAEDVLRHATSAS